MKIAYPFSCLVLCLILLFTASCSVSTKYSADEQLELVSLGDGSFMLDSVSTDQVANSYTAYLAEILGGRWNLLEIGTHGATVLRKGDNPIWKHRKFKELLLSEPDAVIIFLGSQDITDNNWQLRKFFNGDYTKLVMSLKKLDSMPKVLVCSVPSLPALTGADTERVEEINAQIKVIAQVTGASFLDISSALLENPPLNFNDQGISIVGRRLIAQMIFDELNTPK